MRHLSSNRNTSSSHNCIHKHVKAGNYTIKTRKASQVDQTVLKVGKKSM